MFRILTFNMNWKCIQDDACFQRAKDMIQHNKPYDFVFLQEAYRMQKINIDESLNKFISKSNNEVIITYYPKKYIIEESLTGSLTTGRPYHILFLNCGLCVINIHSGHNNEFDNFNNDVYQITKNPNLLNRLLINEIILAGDFNMELPKTIRLFNNRILGKIINVQTCCFPELKYSYDTIFTTFYHFTANIINIKISDHTPVLCVISTPKIIGYDFDGVLHKSVSDPDEKGERHGTDLKLIPFNEILDKINNDIKMNHKLYIITARNRDNDSLNTITKFLSRMNIRNMSVLFSNGEDKSDLMEKFCIEEFYEDSPLRINQIIDSINNKKLFIKRLFMVIPEKNNWVDII
jgi:hypothetical protein